MCIIGLVTATLAIACTDLGDLSSNPPADGGAESGYVNPGIRCPNNVCSPGQICCEDSAGTLACKAPDKTGACGGQVVVTCDDALDCAGGELCCWTKSSGLPKTAGCLNPASCQGAGTAVHCDPHAPPACPNGLSCTVDGVCK